MKLYHGSNMEIDKPDLSRSKPFKDFGQGFYLSPGYEQAHALAKQKTDQLQSGEPCVTIFELEDQIIKTSDLQIKIFDDYCEEWAQFVLLNRDRSHTHPAHTYGKVWGLESFGFSAPYKVLDEKLGFTAENVYNQVKAML